MTQKIEASDLCQCGETTPEDCATRPSRHCGLQDAGPSIPQRVVCPHCGDVTEHYFLLKEFTCGACDKPFEPVTEPASTADPIPLFGGADMRCETLVQAMRATLYERGSGLPLPLILGAIRILEHQILKEAHDG